MKRNNNNIQHGIKLTRLLLTFLLVLGMSILGRAEETELTKTNTETEDIIATAVKDNDVSCYHGNNGKITVTANGGTGTLSYSIDGGANYQSSNVFNGLVAGTYSIIVKDENNVTNTTNSVLINEPTSIFFGETHVNVSCNSGTDGSANLYFTGGTPPYETSFDGSDFVPATSPKTYSNLAAGYYEKIVKDANGCIATGHVTITQPDEVNIAATDSKTNVTCFGGNDGAFSVTASGGNGTYTYSLHSDFSDSNTSGVFAGLTEGIYSVYVKDENNCEDPTPMQVTISQPDEVNIAATDSKTNVTCFGGNDGTFSVTASGGNGNYTYSLYSDFSDSNTSGVFAGLTEGTYSVYIKDENDCEDPTPLQVTISQPDEINIIGTDSKTNVTCFGGNDGAFSVAASGGNGTYTYSLYSDFSGSNTSGDFTGLTEGTYSVYVKDENDCEDPTPLQVTITQRDELILNIASVNYDCFGGPAEVTFVATGGTGHKSYTFNDETNTTGVFYDVAAGTNLPFSIIDENGCGPIIGTITVDESQEIIVSVTQLTPAQCGASDGVAKVSVSGGEGNYSYLWDNGNTNATASNLSAGTHAVTVTNETGCSKTVTVNISEMDSGAPTIICAGNIDTIVATGNCQIELDIAAPSVDDNCATNLSAVNDFNNTQDASDIYSAGTTVIVWTVTDNAGNSATCEQVVTVKTRPVAKNDTVEIQNLLQTLSPLINDTDCDDNINPSSFEITIQPENGTVSDINTTDGTFVYTPAEGFTGTDSIQYKICDEDNLCDEAWIAINVGFNNNPPVAVNDTIIAGDCKPSIIDVLQNDSDPDGNELTTPVIISDVEVGSLVINVDGTFEYTPESEFEGDVIFTYEICDVQALEANQLCAQANVIIKVSKDTDCDNVPDNIDIDADNDGILNTDDGITADNDDDGIPNYLDIDSDNDGILDNIEGQPENNYRVPLWKDTDGDGWDDEYDLDNGGTYFELTDTDGDGTPDFIDTNTDGDVFNDYNEGWDANFDTIPDVTPLGTDSDGDGLDDAFDTVNGSVNNNNPIGSNAPLPDYNNDGVRDWRDSENNKPIPGGDDDLAVGCEVFIPNGFSPDGDNINDYFEIRMDCDEGESTFGEQHPNSKMLIYNRWGNLLYEKEGYGQNDDPDFWWDGKSENSWTVGKNKVPSGTYVYVLILVDGTVYKGTVYVNY